MSLEVLPYEFRCSNDAFSIEDDENMAARELALQSPLKTGLQFSLALKSPLQNPALNARKLPCIPGSGPTVVQLRDELQPGLDAFSQVWTAECVDDLDSPAACLVLKIIQPSLCRGPPLVSIDEYYEPWDLAHNEAWVYRNLPHYQGLLIPYFFGLSTMVTPCGEEAWVLVLEFIPGLTFNDVTHSASSRIRNFCALGVKAVREFARGGWTLGDIRSPNFILTGDPDASAVVIIDLFLAEPIASSEDRELIVSLQAQHFFWKFVSDAEDADHGLYKWTKKNVPDFASLLLNPPDSDDEEKRTVDSDSVRSPSSSDLSGETRANLSTY
ncbi:hypothetical protein C8F01DRAFT_1115198 [Mycena amicta]|nr:hypothetical protein C8F01DRAFT_1115198 [Mycena amicta]